MQQELACLTLLIFKQNMLSDDSMDHYDCCVPWCHVLDGVFCEQLFVVGMYTSDCPRRVLHMFVVAHNSMNPFPMYRTMVLKPCCSFSRTEKTNVHERDNSVCRAILRGHCSCRSKSPPQTQIFFASTPNFVVADHHTATHNNSSNHTGPLGEPLEAIHIAVRACTCSSYWYGCS